MNIILIGFKNCGKSTVGRKMAQLLQMEFIDTDDLLKKIYKEETQHELSIPDIHKKEGEEKFRELEHRTVLRLSTLQNAVIATGGGIILKPENVVVLKTLGKIFYLCVSEQELLARQNRTRVPAFLNTQDPTASFMKMYAARKPLYEKNADYIITADNKHAHEVAENILEIIEHG